MNFLTYETKDNQTLQLFYIHQGLNHQTTTSHNEKYWHPNIYKHWINFKHVFQGLKFNILKTIQAINSNIMALMSSSLLFYTQAFKKIIILNFQWSFYSKLNISYTLSLKFTKPFALNPTYWSISTNTKSLPQLLNLSLKFSFHSH